MGNVEMVCGFVLVCREIWSIKFDCFDFLTVYCYWTYVLFGLKGRDGE